MRRVSVAVSIAVLVAAALSGCSFSVCAGAGVPLPTLLFDASPWTAAHPGASVTACVAKMCQTADATAPVLHLAVPGDGAERHVLTVTSDGTSRALDVRAHFTLHEYAGDGSPCGTVTSWAEDARLNADGRLHFWASATSVPFPPQVAPTPPRSA